MGWLGVLAATSMIVAGAPTAGTTAPATVTARVYLTGRDPLGLAATARSVSDPDSPDYRKFLSPTEFLNHFGPTAGQTSAVEGWLGAQGLTVTGTNQHYVAVSGTQAQITALQHDQALPAGVLAILATTSQAQSPTAPADDSTSTPVDVGSPCSHYYGEVTVHGLPKAFGRTTFPASSCGYLPSQFRQAYGVTRSGLTGKGVTIGIVGMGSYPDLPASANGYITSLGDEALAPDRLSQLLPPDPATRCQDPIWGSEVQLDVTAAHAMAPGAGVVYSGSACVSRDDAQATLLSLLDGLDRIVDTRAADVVSTSWSTPESTVTPGTASAWDQTFEQAAVEGIGLFFASGDEGDESVGGTEPPQPDFPASDPWVTGVGGTSLEVDNDGDYLFETGWGSTQDGSTADGTGWSVPPPGTFTNGAGGGTSGLFTQPWYQDGVVPHSLATAHGQGAPMRVVPDVAMDADFTDGLAIVPPLPGATNGGTSLASPMFAAVQADAQQALGGPLGFANPLFYAHAGSPMFHDVTDHPLGTTPVVTVDTDVDADGAAIPGTATLIGYGHDESLAATPGYDDVTGLGSPAAGYLAESGS